MLLHRFLRRHFLILVGVNETNGRPWTADLHGSYQSSTSTNWDTSMVSSSMHHRLSPALQCSVLPADRLLMSVRHG